MASSTLSTTSPSSSSKLTTTSRPTLRYPLGSSPTSSYSLPHGGTSSSGSASGRNPLNLKVQRILSANLEDEGTRAALNTLGEFETLFAASPAANGHAESGKGLGATGSTSLLNGDSLNTSEVTGKSSASGASGVGAALRKGGLRKEVDSRMAEASREFLDAFSEVNDKLSLLQSHLDAMHVCCDEVQEQLTKANTGTRYLLEHAEGLRKERATTTVQQSLVHIFLTRFTLTDSELRALTSREVPVGPELFAAMDKTERIRLDCRALLSGEAGEGTKAGLDIMDYTSQHLESGYAKIFKWCAFESRGFSKEVLEVSSTMRDAIQRLKARPDLLNEILTILGMTRSTSILNLFLDALTRGGPNGLPRPIELSAHDPIRYIGDMLAWIHQTMAGEREFLESLFGIKEDGRWVGSVRVYKKKERPTRRTRLAKVKEETAGVESGTASLPSSPTLGGHDETDEELNTALTPEDHDDEDRLRKLLDKDLEGCGRPLKIRVQQTIKSQEGSIMTYKIATLIHFYRITMERTIGLEALMTKVLAEITKQVYEAFFDILEASGRALLRFIQPPAAALSAPISLRDALGTLREIMAVYSTSLLEDATAHDIAHALPSTTASMSIKATVPTREAEFKPVLDAVLDPAVLMCEKMAGMRPSAWDQSVFKINCIEAMLTALEGFGFTERRMQALEAEEEGHLGTITDQHYTHLLKDSGLEPILTALGSLDSETPLSHLPAASLPVLSASISSFSTFLSTIDALSSPRLSLLPPRIANSIHRAALDRVSQAYGRMYDAVMDESNRYEGRTTMMRRSKEDVMTLLGLGD